MAGGVYTGGGATVVMDPAPVVYVKVFHEGSGPARHLGKKADAVAIYARQTAPQKTGYMSRNIFVNRNRNELGRYAFGYQVYTPVFYAGFVHEGTGPSPRWPNSRKFMKFAGNAGDFGYADFIMHPGISAQPFLQNALIAMAN